MATPVEAPKLGNTVEECLLSKWLKRKGDAVTAGDLIAEIETDKATFELTAPVSGILLDVFFDEGALVPVFTNLCVIGAEGESTAAYKPTGADPPVRSAPPGQPLAPEQVAAAATAAVSPAGRLSPRARRFAEERNFYPALVTGSGPGGRVLEQDMRNLYLGAVPLPGQARKPIETLAPRPVSAPSTIRQKIARRMRESLATTAQYTLNSSAPASGLLAMRARIKAETGAPDININDLVAFCTIAALREVPSLNAEFIDGQIRPHAEIHLGFACDTPRGLMVPVIHDAHTLTIAELAVRAKELAGRAVRGAISPDDLSGATFTISNLGNLGVEWFTPLLNPPQVAILGIGAIQLKPVRRDSRIEIIDEIGLSLTCDHQVIDGAPGARFLQVLAGKIEHVGSLCTI